MSEQRGDKEIATDFGSSKASYLRWQSARDVTLLKFATNANNLVTSIWGLLERGELP